MPGFTPFLPFSLNLFRFVKEIFSPYSHRPNLTPNLHDPFDFLLLRFEELRGKRSHWDDIAEIRQTLRNSLRLKFIPLRLRASTRKKYEVKVEVGWGRSFSKVWWDKKDLENCVVVQRLLCSNFEGGRRGKRGEREEREKRESNRRDWFGWSFVGASVSWIGVRSIEDFQDVRSSWRQVRSRRRHNGGCYRAPVASQWVLIIATVETSFRNTFVRHSFVCRPGTRRLRLLLKAERTKRMKQAYLVNT